MMLSEDESTILAICSLLSFWAIVRLRINCLHDLFLRGNLGVGLIRLSVILSFVWFVFVLKFFADDSVVGIYILFYLVMGYALSRNLGEFALALFGFNLRVDVYERKNFAVALLFASSTLSTALIFGGSLWGDADAIGNDDGGWWIPLAFFALGWLSLIIVFALYLLREKVPLSQTMRQERNVQSAEAAAAYLLSSAIVLTEAVAGDFFGWRESILSFASIAGLLVVHECFNTISNGKTGNHIPSSDTERNRSFEIFMYFAVAILSWIINRVISKLL